MYECKQCKLVTRELLDADGLCRWCYGNSLYDYDKKEEDLLDKVKKVLKERKETHGDFKENFKTIASFWSNYLDKTISSKDVSIMMMLLKIARMKGGSSNEDDFIDLIGYANLGEKL